ncbi:hypothetical protein GO287_03648 [Ralstonia solanacearum]|nr:hypothetical protein [Ralstonia solanacearum]
MGPFPRPPLGCGPGLPGRARGAEEFQRARQLAVLGGQQRLVGERRQAGLLALAQQLAREAGVIVPHQRQQGGGIRVAGLDQHFARQPGAAGAPGHLHQRGEQVLAGTEVVAEQGRIGRHHAHQRHALEVMPLGDHLRADQDIDGPFVHGVEQRLGAALAAGGVGVDTRHARLRKQRAEGLLDALRAAPQRRDVDVAAVRAMVRDARFVAAVVAAQPVLRLVQHQIRRAARAA